MNNMNNKINEKKKMEEIDEIEEIDEKKISKKRGFKTFYLVEREVYVDNTDGINITTADYVQEIFFTPDECYNFLIKQIPELKNVLWEYATKTSFISKIMFLKDKLSEINNYFSDNIIYKYGYFENDYPGAANEKFYDRILIETNKKGSVQIDDTKKFIVDKKSRKNNLGLYGICIVPLKYDPDKINN